MPLRDSFILENIIWKLNSEFIMNSFLMLVRTRWLQLFSSKMTTEMEGIFFFRAFLHQVMVEIREIYCPGQFLLESGAELQPCKCCSFIFCCLNKLER